MKSKDSIWIKIGNNSHGDWETLLQWRWGRPILSKALKFLNRISGWLSKNELLCVTILDKLETGTCPEENLLEKDL